jgi:hypothetical protein
VTSRSCLLVGFSYGIIPPNTYILGPQRSRLASPEGAEMTGKFIKLLLVAPLLVGCIDKEKRRAEFMERCAAAKFGRN